LQEDPEPPPADFDLAEEIAEAVLAQGGATVIDDVSYTQLISKQCQHSRLPRGVGGSHLFFSRQQIGHHNRYCRRFLHPGNSDIIHLSSG